MRNVAMKPFLSLNNETEGRPSTIPPPTQLTMGLHNALINSNYRSLPKGRLHGAVSSDVINKHRSAACKCLVKFVNGVKLKAILGRGGTPQ